MRGRTRKKLCAPTRNRTLVNCLRGNCFTIKLWGQSVDNLFYINLESISIILSDAILANFIQNKTGGENCAFSTLTTTNEVMDKISCIPKGCGLNSRISASLFLNEAPALFRHRSFISAIYSRNASVNYY